MVSLKSWSSVEFKIKKMFFLSGGLPRIENLCEHGIFVHFNVIFLQIKILSIKNSISNLISCQKMKQLCVPNRLKALKKNSSGLIGRFNTKKFSNSI